MRSIHSLEDLRKAKKDLVLKRAITKQEFGRQLGVVRNDAGAYLVKKVLLPLGIGVVAAFAIKYFFSKKPTQPDEAPAKSQEQLKAVIEDQNKSSWLSYVSILLSLIKIVQGIVSGSRAAGDFGSNEQEADNSEENGEEAYFSPRDFVNNFQRQTAKKEVT